MKTFISDPSAFSLSMNYDILVRQIKKSILKRISSNNIYKSCKGST